MIVSTEKVPSDATFFGAQYLSYNLSSRGNVLDSNQDQVSLDFRTKQADGLLFYTGTSLLGLTHPSYTTHCACVSSYTGTSLLGLNGAGLAQR